MARLVTVIPTCAPESCVERHAQRQLDAGGAGVPGRRGLLDLGAVDGHEGELGGDEDAAGGDQEQGEREQEPLGHGRTPGGGTSSRPGPAVSERQGRL